MKNENSLLMGAHRGIKSHGGSGKTKKNHFNEAKRFVSTLHQLGFGVRKWENVSMKHVAAVVGHWLNIDGLTAATVKEYLSAVRICCSHFGNSRVAESRNEEFGIPNRTYVTNSDKSLPENVFREVVHTLRNGSLNEQRLAAQLMLQRSLGLRFEESCKLNPERAVLSDGRVLISEGTKGGRDRILSSVPEVSRKALVFARDCISPRGSTMDPAMSEAQWRKFAYATLAKQGISRSTSGASMHGNRHAYAQGRYECITGFLPPCKFPSKVEFRSNAERVAGKAWSKLDRDARLIIKSELGHGPDRDSVVSQYLGSK
ncbi:putative integrase [Desulfovibrio sp. X2]|uniref:phage integrase N-terminal domain-containing protein n=1 Tax=Desulfovibrio sp. X2 TaxID=941449 RepID=UPI000358AB8C|nr:phage integrase N-terminal domain-containing protein [Desulfovibrio sp. X2]EPR43550.1 putative integrase [Desulfovibrio sp. X2]